VLEVADKHPVSEVGVRTPSLTVVDLSPSGNGWFVDARFQSGERFKLAINKASIGWVADPREGTVKLMPNGQSWRGRSYQVGQGY
jgi:hypothetical protein